MDLSVDKPEKILYAYEKFYGISKEFFFDSPLWNELWDLRPFQVILN
jgi:hypothetical protein